MTACDAGLSAYAAVVAVSAPRPSNSRCSIISRMVGAEALTLVPPPEPGPVSAERVTGNERGEGALDAQDLAVPHQPELELPALQAPPSPVPTTGR